MEGMTRVGQRQVKGGPFVGGGNEETPIQWQWHYDPALTPKDGSIRLRHLATKKRCISLTQVLPNLCQWSAATLPHTTLDFFPRQMFRQANIAVQLLVIVSWHENAQNISFRVTNLQSFCQVIEFGSQRFIGNNLRHDGSSSPFPTNQIYPNHGK
jgi:hypothetical protein